MTDFTFLGSKITEDGACSHEIKRHLAPWKKSYDKPRQHIKKQRYHFATKVPLVKIMVFQWSCTDESWIIKKAEPQRIDAYELWYWKRLLKFPWTARSIQSTLKEINPEY